MRAFVLNVFFISWCLSFAFAQAIPSLQRTRCSHFSHGISYSFRITNTPYSNILTEINSSGIAVGYYEPNFSPQQPFILFSSSMQMLQGLGGTTTVNAINNKNHAVGRSFLPNYLNQMPMFWENGQTHILPSLGGSSSDAIAINDHDSIVGWSRFITGENRAVLWKANRIFDLGNFSSDTDTHPFSINNRSEIVGSSGSGFLSAYRAFYYKEHEFENLGTLPGDFLSGARDINNHGEIVGYSCSDLWDGSCKSVLWNSNHQMSPLEMVPGFPASYAYSINDCSEVVGYATIFGGSIDSRRAFVRTQNQIINLNSIIPLQQGMILREASSINNVGQIAGFGSMNGHAFGFILTPQ